MGEMVMCASGAGVLGGLAGNPAGESGVGTLRHLLMCQMSFLSGEHAARDWLKDDIDEQYDH